MDEERQEQLKSRIRWGRFFAVMCMILAFVNAFQGSAMAFACFAISWFNWWSANQAEDKLNNPDSEEDDE